MAGGRPDLGLCEPSSFCCSCLTQRHGRSEQRAPRDAHQSHVGRGDQRSKGVRITAIRQTSSQGEDMQQTHVREKLSPIAGETGSSPLDGIVVNDLIVCFAGVGETLGPFSFAIPRGRFVSLVGPSAIGKSSLLFALAGIYYPCGLGATCSGSVRIEGRDPESLGSEELTLCFQDPHLLDHLSVEENILLPARWADVELRQVAQTRLEVLIDHCGLQEHRTKRPRELSGGTLSRAALARALIIDPDYLLLDEPLSGVDTASRHRIVSFLREDRRGRGALMVTHQLEDALFFSDLILILNAGGRIEPFEVEPIPVDTKVDEMIQLTAAARAEILTSLRDDTTKLDLV